MPEIQYVSQVMATSEVELSEKQEKRKITLASHPPLIFQLFQLSFSCFKLTGSSKGLNTCSQLFIDDLYIDEKQDIQVTWVSAHLTIFL